MPVKREKNQWAGQLVEIVRAVKLLSRQQGASNEELEEELGVKLRSIQRLKKTLDEQLHLPLQAPCSWSFSSLQGCPMQ